MELKKYYINILSDKDIWMNEFIPTLIKKLEINNTVRWIHSSTDITEGDFAFFLSCSQIIAPDILAKNKHNLVVHASALPKGKGWSPLTWQILEGSNEIPITLFEAAEQVDSGKIYLSDILKFTGYELVDELRSNLGEKIINICLEFIDKYPDVLIMGKNQEGEETFYPKRRPKNSELDINKTIKEQFNLLRVVDNEKYPAFFFIDGHKYILKIYRGD